MYIVKGLRLNLFPNYENNELIESVGLFKNLISFLWEISQVIRRFSMNGYAGDRF